MEDLNLMCRRERFVGEVARRSLGQNHRLDAGEGVLIAVAIDRFECAVDRRTIELAHLDAISLEPGTSVELKPSAAASRAIVVRIRRRPLASENLSRAQYPGPKGTP